MPVKIAHASISGVFVLALSHFAAGQAYTITDLGTLGGTYSSARAINAGGHVVGTATTSYGTKHAFIWEDGHMEQLDHLPWITENGSLGRDINDAGQVVGCSMWFPNEVPWTATLWERTDETWQVRQIGRPHGSIAMSVNNAGHVAGRDLSDACGTCRAWRWENGNLTYLDCLFEPCVSEAHDINKLGEVAGSSDGPSEQCPGSYPWCSRAVVWNPNGHITDLGPAGGADHWAYGINDAGEVAGAGRPEGGWETAFIWLPAPAYGLPAGMNYLGTLGGGHSRALALNNVGAVVGGAEIWNGTEHAYRWQDGTMMDLNDLLVSGPGWELKVAYDINDAGQIVGDGEINGRRHAFLCTPCLCDR